MDGVTVSVLGALVALAVAIVLILKKIQPTYAMLFGAVIGGLIGGAGLTGTVNYIISGTQGIVSAIIRIVMAGILAGALIESGAAERIAEAIMNRLGAKRCLIAITLATWVLTAVGVFGDVACITVAPIALQMAKRAGYHKMGVLMAQLGAVRAGNVMSPNPNAIAAAEGFNVPLTSIIAVGIIPAVTALVVTSLIAYRLRMRGTEIADSDVNMISDKELPPPVGSAQRPVRHYCSPAPATDCQRHDRPHDRASGRRHRRRHRHGQDEGNGTLFHRRSRENERRRHAADRHGRTRRHHLQLLSEGRYYLFH